MIQIQILCSTWSWLVTQSWEEDDHLSHMIRFQTGKEGRRVERVIYTGEKERCFNFLISNSKRCMIG